MARSSFICPVQPSAGALQVKALRGQFLAKPSAAIVGNPYFKLVINYS